jgi:hypothetical protein
MGREVMVMQRADAQSIVVSPKPRAVRLAAGAVIALVAAAALAVAPSVAPQAGAAAPTALLQLVQNGGGTVTVEAANKSPRVCVEDFFPNVAKCEYTDFLQGETVTLTASAVGPVTFQGWSDERCPRGAIPTCSLTLTDEQMVVALFSPQSVDVSTAFPGGADPNGKVTIAAPGRDTCTAFQDGINNECGTFALFSTVTLVATGTKPAWDPLDCDDVQTSADGTSSTCIVTLTGHQHAKVGFAGAAPPTDAPPRVNVIFRARKTGDGSGTIGGSLDCGGRCSITVPFRERVTLVAKPATGSRFVRWSGGCGTTPTCTLQAAGNSVAGEFALLSTSPTPGPGGKFEALVGKIVSTGRGRGRKITIPVRVNAPAGMRAKLVKGRRQLKSSLFTLRVGSSRRVLSVPRRAAAGRYRLRLTIRDRKGTTVAVDRAVRLRR